MSQIITLDRLEAIKDELYPDARQRLEEQEALKHLGGEHDQGKHGRWASGEGANIPEGWGGRQWRDLGKRENWREFEDDMANWQDRLSGKQRAAFSNYSQTLYHKANPSMREYDGPHSNSKMYTFLAKSGGTSFQDRMQIREMHSALEKASTPYDTKVYRGMDGEVFKGLKKGDRFKDNAFVSTTANPKVAKRFAEQSGRGGIVVEIRLPKGSKAGPIPSSFSSDIPEDEILLQWGTEFEVISLTSTKAVLGAVTP